MVISRQIVGVVVEVSVVDILTLLLLNSNPVTGIRSSGHLIASLLDALLWW